MNMFDDCTFAVNNETPNSTSTSLREVMAQVQSFRDMRLKPLYLGIIYEMWSLDRLRKLNPKEREGRTFPNFYMSWDYLEANDCTMESTIKGSNYRQINPLLGNSSTPFLTPMVQIYSEGDREFFFYLSDMDMYWAGVAVENAEYYERLSNFRFLDYNYIYRPEDFEDLSGSQWKTFRKNLRKTESDDWEYVDLPHWKYQYGDTRNERDPIYAFIRLIELWADHKETVEGIDDILWYYHNSPYVRGLYYKGRLVAIAIFELNKGGLAFFRYCFTDPVLDDKAVSERIRLEVFREMKAIHHVRFVNDGGTLGNEGLEFFKDRLNPYCKCKVFSKVIP